MLREVAEATNALLVVSSEKEHL